MGKSELEFEKTILEFEQKIAELRELSSSLHTDLSAEIEALEPGPVGNVAAATISVVETAPLRGKIRVINENPTQGGGVRQVGVVTRADMDRLKAQLLQQLQQRAYVDPKRNLLRRQEIRRRYLFFKRLEGQQLRIAPVHRRSAGIDAHLEV